MNPHKQNWLEAESGMRMVDYENDKFLHHDPVCHIIDKQCEINLDFLDKSLNSKMVSKIGNSKSLYLVHKRIVAN